MPTDLIASNLVVWNPNTSQVVTLESGEYVITMLDADYPAITTTKNLSASIQCLSRTKAAAGVGKALSAAVSGTSTATTTKLSTGFERVDASVQALSSAIRCSIFSSGLQFSTSPTSVSYAPSLAGIVPASGAIQFANGDYAFAAQSTGAAGTRTIRLCTVSQNATTFQTTMLAEGQVVGATTIANTELAYAGTNDEFYPYCHLRRNPSNDNVHFVWRPVQSNKAYYYSQQWGTFYLNSHTSFAPNTLTTNSWGPAAVYPETNSLAHIFYLTQFSAGGKTYVTPAMMTYNGTTWSSVRFGGSTWDANGYTVVHFQLYRADANDLQKLYMVLLTAAGVQWIVWVDLNLRTASTPFASLTGRSVSKFNMAHSNRIPTVDDSVLQSGQTGNLVIRTGQDTISSSWTDEMNARLTYTAAGWKTPSVSYTTVTTQYGSAGANATFMTGGYVVANGLTYYVTYWMNGTITRTLWAQYRRVDGWPGVGYSFPAQPLGVVQAAFEISTTGYYIRCNENQIPDSYSHLIATSNAFGSATHFFRVSWAADQLSMHLTATLEDVTSAVLDLKVLSAAQNVALDGTLTGVSTASLDLRIGDKQNLASLATGASAATATLLSSNARIDASVFCVSSAGVSMRVGKTLLEALAESRASHQVALQVLHNALLDGTLVGQSSASMTAASDLRITSTAAAVSAGTAVLNVAVTLPGTASGDSSATAQLLLRRFLSGLLVGNSTASLDLGRSVDLEDGVSVLTKSAPVSVRTPKP